MYHSKSYSQSLCDFCLKKLNKHVFTDDIETLLDGTIDHSSTGKPQNPIVNTIIQIVYCLIRSEKSEVKQEVQFCMKWKT